MNRKTSWNSITVIILLSTVAFASMAFINTATAEEDPVELWALIVCADDLVSGWTFGADAAYMYYVLTEDYEFEDDHIIYLHVDPDNAPGSDNKTTKKNMRTAINTTLVNLSNENDIIFIFFTNHGAGYNDDEQKLEDGARQELAIVSDEGPEHYISGTYYGVDECLCIYNPDVPENYEYYMDDEIAADLDYLASQNSYGKLIFAIMACYSGGLIDDLSAKNRIIMTAANETHTAKRLWPPTDLFSAWPDKFIDALHGWDAEWCNETWSVVDKDGGSIMDVVDVTKDGNVSMWEAWNYAWYNDPARIDGEETPWIDDNHNKKPTYMLGADNLDNSDGLFSMETYFGSENLKSPDVNEDGSVDIYDSIIVGSAWGSKPGDPNWNPAADIINNSVIDIYDIVIVASNFGKEYSDPPPSVGEEGFLLTHRQRMHVRKDQTFSVRVVLAGVVDLYGWEFKLYWNSSILNCTGAQVYVPDVWGENAVEAGPGIENDFNASHGMYWIALSALYPAPSFNGSMVVVTLTFEAKAIGYTILDLQDTKLGDYEAYAIPHTTMDGLVVVGR